STGKQTFAPRCGHKARCRGGQGLVHRVAANPAEPVLGVGVIPLAAVHDAVPEASVGSLDLLTPGMRCVELVAQQEDASHAAAGGVLVDHFAGIEQVVYCESRRCPAATAAIEGAAPIDV